MSKLMLFLLSIILMSVSSCDDRSNKDPLTMNNNQHRTSGNLNNDKRMRTSKNIKKAKIVDLILGSPSMGGGEDFYSFIPQYYSKLSETEKYETDKVLVELIEDDETWNERMGHYKLTVRSSLSESLLRFLLRLRYKLTGRASSYELLLTYPRESAIFDQKTKVMFICSELNLTDAVPKIEKLLTIKDLNKKHHLSLLHHAIAKFKIKKAVPFLDNQIRFLLQPYTDEPAWSDEAIARANSYSAMHTLLELDFERGFSHIPELLKSMNDYDESKDRIVISAFKKKYSDQWAGYLYEATKDDAEKISQMLYTLGGMGLIKQRNRELMDYFNKIDPTTKQRVENIIVANIDKEISTPRFGSISMSGVLQLKSATPKLMEISKSSRIDDIRMESLMMALGDLEVTEAKNFLEEYASHFYEEQPTYDSKVPDSGTFKDVALLNWTKAYIAVISLTKIDPIAGLSYIEKCLEVGSENLIINRLTTIERCLGVVKEKYGDDADVVIKKQFNANALDSLKIVMKSERVRKSEIPWYGDEMRPESNKKLINIEEVIIK